MIIDLRSDFSPPDLGSQSINNMDFQFRNIYILRFALLPWDQQVVYNGLIYFAYEVIN